VATKTNVLRFRPILTLQLCSTSHLIPFTPVHLTSFTANYQEACYEGRTQAGNRNWRTRTSEGVVQAFGRGKEEEARCEEAQGGSKESDDFQEVCA
jgi:hypothetical protein